MRQPHSESCLDLTVRLRTLTVSHLPHRVLLWKASSFWHGKLILSMATQTVGVLSWKPHHKKIFQVKNFCLLTVISTQLFRRITWSSWLQSQFLHFLRGFFQLLLHSFTQIIDQVTRANEGEMTNAMSNPGTGRCGFLRVSIKLNLPLKTVKTSDQFSKWW